MTGGRPQTVLDDETDLNGPRVDVDRRVGWVLRMARMTTPGPAGGPLRLEAMAEAVGVSTTRLHRVETGATRSGQVTDAYERVLAMPEGSLRAPVDVACRTFPYAQPDRDPGQPVTSTQEMSALTEALQG
ncbi:helix-turn-helix domain-containing protein, partial [Streptomyces rhizosphaericus]